MKNTTKNLWLLNVISRQMIWPFVLYCFAYVSYLLTPFFNRVKQIDYLFETSVLNNITCTYSQQCDSTNTKNQVKIHGYR